MSSHVHPASGWRIGGRATRSCIGLAAFIVLVLVAALLMRGYRSHVFDVLVWLPLVLCPLIHAFMHGSHGQPKSKAGRADMGERQGF